MKTGVLRYNGRMYPNWMEHGRISITWNILIVGNQNQMGDSVPPSVSYNGLMLTYEWNVRNIHMKAKSQTAWYTKLWDIRLV